MEKNTEPTLNKIQTVALGGVASKVLATALKIDLFSLLASSQPLSAQQIKEKLNLKSPEQTLYDFLDCLVSQDILSRDGIGEKSFYSNSNDADNFLDKNKPTYSGSFMIMLYERSLKNVNALEEILLSGKKTEVKDEQSLKDWFKDYPEMRKSLHASMRSNQLPNFQSLSKKFDFSKYKKFLDIGGADGTLAVQIAKDHPHLSIVTTDLEASISSAQSNIELNQLQERIQVQALNAVKDDYPQTDIFTCSMVIHHFSNEQKANVLKKAYSALSENGVFICMDQVLDDDRRTNTKTFLQNMFMFIEFQEGNFYSFKDFETWAQQAGFKKVEKIELTSSMDAMIAYK